MIDELLEQSIKDQHQKALEAWGSRHLLKAWVIIQTCDYEDGEAILRESDLEELAQCLLEIKNEIKALKEQG